jgi:hypothetical protein
VRRLSKWLRSKMLAWWKGNMTISYIKWVIDKYELFDVTTKINWVSWHDSCYAWAGPAGRGSYHSWWKRQLLVTHQDFVPVGDAIQRAAKTSWWRWDADLHPFHWCWHEFYQDMIWDGLKVHFQEPSPKYLKSQRDIGDAAVKL